MIVRHTQQQVDNYYANPAIGQSMLKIIVAEGIQKFIEVLAVPPDQRKKRHFKIGSAVDTKITMGEDCFQEAFYTSSLEKLPGEKTVLVLESAFNEVMKDFRADEISNLDDYANYIYEAANREQYYMNRKKDSYLEDARIATIIKENGRDYWLDLITKQGKEVLSNEEHSVVQAVVDSLTQHPHTSRFLKDSEGVDLIFQLPLYFSIDGVMLKSLLDLLYINHKTRKIVPLDIKTMSGHTLRFNDAVRSRRYDFQGAFYSEAIMFKESLELISKLINKDVTDYTLSNFAFIVESTTSTGTPFVFPLSTEVLNHGTIGHPVKNLLGWSQALQIYKEWEKHNFVPEQALRSTHGIIHIQEDYKYDLTVNPALI